MTDYLENALAKHSVGLEAYTMPTSIFLALLKASPTDSGSQINEVNAADYTRLDISAKLTVNAGAVILNEQAIFAAATSNWGSITHVALLDAETAGNMLYYGELQTAKSIDVGDVFAILANGLIIQLD